MPSDFIIHPPSPVAPEAVLEGFRPIGTSLLSDNIHRLSGVVGLSRIHRERKLIGTALTVKTRPGDNLGIYKALTQLQRGHVLVIDAGGDLTNAIVGELIMEYALQRGCAGFIVDGAVRDSAAFIAADFPCYARGVCHRGPYKNGPAWLNVPVSIGGQVIHPGDIVVGDEDGIVTFPLSDAARVLDAATASSMKEAVIRQEIATGSARQSWLDAMLNAHGIGAETPR